MITYFIDGKKHFLLNNGESVSEKTWNSWQEETAKKDEAAGYRDRMAGYYDKWYRYNRNDNGAAYDRGAVRATREPKCPEEFHIIECLESVV